MRLAHMPPGGSRALDPICLRTMSEGRYPQRIAVWTVNSRREQGEKADILSRSTTAPSRASFQKKTSLVDRRKTSYREFRHSQILVSLQAGGGFYDCFGNLVETHFNPNLLAVDENRWRAGDSEFFVRSGCRSIKLVEMGLIGDSAIETRAVDAHASGDLAQCILGIGAQQSHRISI